jgi:hypothetical protein
MIAGTPFLSGCGDSFMRQHRFFLALCAVTFALAPLTSAVQASAQDDSPSLGDVARQARQQKQQREAQEQADSATGKDAADKDGQKSKEDQKSNDEVKSNDGQNAVAPNTVLQNQNQNQSQNKDASGPNAAAAAQAHKPAKHVITNDEIPSTGGPTGYRPPLGPQSSNSDPQSPGGDQPADTGEKLSAANWTSQIQAQKNAITALQGQIGQLSDSIQYASPNCVSNCAEWNEHQKQKQDQAESMKARLEEQQKHLEEMQDAARRQGYGSSVYDP